MKPAKSRATIAREDDARRLRTAELLSYYQSIPDEFTMLKGILCMNHPFQPLQDGWIQTHDLFDTAMIATRMDAITRENAARASAKRGAQY